MVALLAEGVDRNLHEELELDLNNKVALLAEGVDRNIVILQAEASMLPSPSSRRAWIEISKSGISAANVQVALLAEGVDRNKFTVPFEDSEKRRPPRGGRG